MKMGRIIFFLIDLLIIQFVDAQQTDDFKQTIAGNMVDDGAIFDGSHHKLFSFHMGGNGNLCVEKCSFPPSLPFTLTAGNSDGKNHVNAH